ncbi:MAG: VCBS repeat-containing protein [Terriglobales bacterium]
MLVSTQAYQFGQPFVLFGASHDTFSAPLALSSGLALVGDLNNDGRSDLTALGDGVILAFLGQKNETFTQVSTTLIHPTYGLAALGDVNRDGKPDLLTLEYPAIRVWLGNGDGTFTESTLLSALPEQLNLMSAAIADLDGDGNPDIIVVSYPNELGAPYPLVIYYGNGDGTFQEPVLLPVMHSYT